MKNNKLKLIISTLGILLIYSNAYAGELHGLGDAIFNFVVGLIIFIVGTFLLLYFFRKNVKFVLSTVVNLFLFFTIVLCTAGAGLDDSFFLIFLLFIPIFGQIIAIIWAIAKKIEHRNDEDYHY